MSKETDRLTAENKNCKMAVLLAQEWIADRDKRIAELEAALHTRDRDWVLAIGHALGLDSGFEVPIVPEVEPFKRLFEALAAQEKDDA